MCMRGVSVEQLIPDENNTEGLQQNTNLCKTIGLPHYRYIYNNNSRRDFIKNKTRVAFLFKLNKNKKSKIKGNFNIILLLYDCYCQQKNVRSRQLT